MSVETDVVGSASWQGSDTLFGGQGQNMLAFCTTNGQHGVLIQVLDDGIGAEGAMKIAAAIDANIGRDRAARLSDADCRSAIGASQAS